MKKYSKYVYACPICWRSLAIGKKPVFPIQCCKIYENSSQLIVFDSQIEQQKGMELKILEKSYMIGRLKHHEKFPFFDIHYDTNTNRIKWIPAIYLNGYPDEEVKKFDIHLGSWNYESDLSFIENGKKRVIEIKDLGEKSITRSVRTPVSRKKYEDKIPWHLSPKLPVTKFKEKILWPFFTKTSSLAQFRLKCQLMKAIYGITPEIWAGNKVFRFNEKWKLEEVAK